MVQPLPIAFRKASENQIATYDFFDALQQVGYKTFYGTKDESGNYRLITTQLDSIITYFEILGGTTSGEINFDVTFNQAATIKGDLFFQATFTVKSDASHNNQATPTVRILKVDSSNAESTIGTLVNITTFQANTGNNTVGYRALIDFNIAETNFGVGEKLRIEVILNKSDNDSTSAARVYHDPTSRTTLGSSIVNAGYANDASITSATSDLLVVVPFKVQQ